MPIINGQFIDKSKLSQSQAGKQATNFDENLIRALVIQAASQANTPPEYVSAANALISINKTKELSPAEKEAEEKKKNTERVFRQLEDFYLENKLYYGNNIKGIYGNLFAPTLDPDSPAAKYKAFLMSNSPYFAKAAGDTGNIAVQEQKQAIKPFPTTRFNKTEAIKSFVEIRKKLGLPERDYSLLTGSSGGIPLDIRALGVQFGGK